MVRYINLENEEHNKVVAELQAKNVNLQGTADYFQKEIDSYSKKPKKWQSVIDGLLEQLQAVYSADPQAFDAFATNLFMRGSDKIAKNDYSNFPELTKERWYSGLDQTLVFASDGYKYEMIDGLVWWYEDGYFDIFTDKLWEKVIEKRFYINEDGEHTHVYLKEFEDGIPEWGAVNAKLTRISETDDEIKYSVTYDRQENGKITDRNLTCTMTIKYEDGRYKISQTDFGNL